MNRFIKNTLKDCFKAIVLVFLLVIGGNSLIAQAILTGNSDNEYSAVSYMYISQDYNVDSVDVLDPAKFAVDDVVMLYQAKGLLFEPSSGLLDGYIGNAGQYAIMVVDQIDGNTIIFNAATKFIDPHDLSNLSFAPQQRTGYVSQLIKIPEYTNARVTGTLTAPAWDSVAGTGGVLALYVKNNLYLEGNIDMTGKGFSGAHPGTDVYGNHCMDSADLTVRNYTIAAEDSAGRKGESIICSNYPQLRGFGRTLNGGGGGNGKYSGGGGGSNYNGGGNGGSQSFDCASIDYDFRAEGGNALSSYYTNEVGIKQNRVFFGGGGGCGTQDPGYIATSGGNGGGIIFILADSIVSENGFEIIANGESVTDVATGAGGGGGGGGAILLEINGTRINPTEDLKIYAKGGDGGDTSPTVSSEFAGPGGGGGGGAYWLSNGTHILASNLASESGIYLGSAVLGAGDPADNGTPAGALSNLEAPLKGFLFNTLPADITVCSDVIPPMIDASKPKGGDGAGTYTYRWIESTDKTNWGNASEINTNEDYVFTASLDTTTYFSRVVQSGVMTDSALVITYTVVPAITNNMITATDTICKGLAPHALNSDGVPGGATVGVDGIYVWQSRGKDEVVWTTVDSSDNVHSYAPPGLDTTTYYRREVTSSVCASTSNTIEIEVLEPLVNLGITSRDTLCAGQVPDLLDGEAATGGNPLKLWYEWEMSDTEAGGYAVIGDQEDYTSVVGITSDKYYRRTVYSGKDSTCVSSPTIFKVEALPLISGNEILSSEDTICRGSVLSLDPIHTSVAVTGGDGDYEFIWEVNPDGGGYTSLPSTSTDEDYDGPFSGVSTAVRRVIISGKDGVCKDTALLTQPIITIPIIENNTIITADTAACEGVDINRFRTDHPTGGKNNSYAYQWQWADISGAFTDVPQSGAQDENFRPEPLAGSKEFRRIVQSTDSRAICTDISDAVTVTITPKIENNLINITDIEYLCSEDDLIVQGTSPGTSPQLGGGDGNYVYRWEDKTLSGAWTYTGDVADENSVDYTKTNYTDTRILWRIVSSDGGICIDTSVVDTIVMRELPVVNSFALTDPAVTDFCEIDPDKENMKIDSVAFIIDLENNNSAPFAYSFHEIEIDFDAEGTLGDLDSMHVVTMPGRIEHAPLADIKTVYDYTLSRVVDNFGCEAKALPANVISVTIYDTPKAEVLMADEVFYCGDTLALKADALADSDSSYWTSRMISGDSVHQVITAPTSNETTVELSDRVNSSDRVRFYWNKENGASGCGGIDSTTVLFSRRPDSLNFFAKDTILMFLTKSLTIEAQTSVEGIGSWEIIKGMTAQLTEVTSGPTMFKVELEDLVLDEAHDFQFTFTNGSCGPYTDIQTVIRNDAEQFKVFTPAPGSIGFNDKLALRGIDVGEVVYCYIYNGWGALVRKIVKDPAEGIDDLATLGKVLDDDLVEVQAIWDGLGENGELVEDGIYYYKVMVKLSADDDAHYIDGYVIMKTK